MESGAPLAHYPDREKLIQAGYQRRLPIALLSYPIDGHVRVFALSWGVTTEIKYGSKVTRLDQPRCQAQQLLLALT
jgi:hypothetical protein